MTNHAKALIVDAETDGKVWSSLRSTVSPLSRVYCLTGRDGACEAFSAEPVFGSGDPAQPEVADNPRAKRPAASALLFIALFLIRVTLDQAPRIVKGGRDRFSRPEP